MASTPEKAVELASLMFDGKMHKEYIAKVVGRFPGDLRSQDNCTTSTLTGEKEFNGANFIECKAPLLKIEHKLGLSAVLREGKESCTLFRLLRYDKENNTSLVLCLPQTGRTHQIRVHLQFLGFPVVGDDLYGDPIWKRFAAHDACYSRETVLSIGNLLLEKRQRSSVSGDIVERFNNMTGPEHIFPKWFDRDCTECMAQWIRSQENPEIPLCVPLDCPDEPPRVLLHAYRYYTDAWSFQVPWPCWAHDLF